MERRVEPEAESHRNSVVGHGKGSTLSPPTEQPSPPDLKGLKGFPMPSMSNPGRLPEAEHAFYQALESVRVDHDSEFV